MNSSTMKAFLHDVDQNSELALHKWSKKVVDQSTLATGISVLGPPGITAIGISLALYGAPANILLPMLFIPVIFGYIFYRAQRKYFNYRITKKGVRVIYWDDYPEIAAQSLHLLAGVYILVAIIAGLYMGPMALVGAGGIGLAHAMGMQRITRNENVATRKWNDFNQVIVCRKRNMLESDASFRIYFNKAMTIDEFIRFANKHRDKDIEVEEGKITYLGTLR